MNQSRRSYEEEMKQLMNDIKVISDKLSALSDNPKHRIFDNKELVKYLNVSLRTLQKWRDTGVIRHRKVDRKIFYTLSDVLDMLERHIVDS